MRDFRPTPVAKPHRFFSASPYLNARTTVPLPTLGTKCSAGNFYHPLSCHCGTLLAIGAHGKRGARRASPKGDVTPMGLDRCQDSTLQDWGR